MKVQRIYLDTSVIGGYYDLEFSEVTQKLFRYFEQKVYRPVISDITFAELGPAPENVRKLVSAESEYDFDMAWETEESLALADAYIKNGVVSPNFRSDCRHVALASASNVELLISWNFQHIVQYEKIRRFNAVNLVEGFRQIEIRSPLEVIYHE